MNQMKEQGNDYCCNWKRWRYAERRRKARIGIFFIIIGGLWLGAKMGLFDPAIFWPMTFIAIGTWLIASSVLRRKSDNLAK